MREAYYLYNASIFMVKRVEHHHSSQCPLACTLDIIGDHWTLLIIQRMMFMGYHEYKDFLTMKEGISSNILSERLKRLENRGIVASASHPDSKRRKLYYLTRRGKDLIYVIIEIVRWAEKNLSELIHIPDEKRCFLDVPVEEVAKMVFQQLEVWEKEHLQ